MVSYLDSRELPLGLNDQVNNFEKWTNVVHSEVITKNVSLITHIGSTWHCS